MRQGLRTRVARGIYRDGSGLAAVVNVGTGERRRTTEKRFTFETPLATIVAWQQDARDRLSRGRAARGQLGRDVDTYCDRLAPRLASWRERRAELRAWCAALGPERVRARVTPADIDRVVGQWLTAGVAPKTVNNRVASFRHLYRLLDGRRAWTPCDDWQPLPVHRTPAVVVPAVTIRAVAAALEAREREGILRDGKTRARFMVLASTGRRPSELMRAEPADVDLARRVWAVRDGKGGWSPGAYLNDDMLAAWQAFIAAEAWGSFETSAFARTLRAAGWPKGIRPYQLRHTVGVELADAGVDLGDIQGLLGHRRIETTRRHYVPVRGSRLQAAAERLEGRFGWGSEKGPTDEEAGPLERADAPDQPSPSIER